MRLPQLFAAAVLAAPQVAVAQDDAGQRAVWGALGIALGTVGLGLQLDLSHHRDGTLWKARWATQYNFAHSTERPMLSVSELGVLIGRGRPVSSNWGSLSVGLAAVSGDRGSMATPSGFTTVGLVGEAQLISGRWPHISLTFGGNLNPEHSYAGGALSLVLGRLPWDPPVGRPPILR